MTQLIQAVMALVARVTPSQAEAIADRIRGESHESETWAVESLLRTPAARSELKKMLSASKEAHLSGDYLSGLLMGAASARQQAQAETSVDFVWTGPTTPFVAARRTDQVLLDLIRTAKRDLFLVSFVAYAVPAVVDALNEAIVRNVAVRLLLESSTSRGGSLDMDLLGAMRAAVPLAELYCWQDKAEHFIGGRVHAKLALADDDMAFVGSANLTGHALGKNMEAGVLIHGGGVPEQLKKHLTALIDTGTVRRAV